MNEQAIREAMVRGGIYRLLSVAFLYPTEEVLRSLSRLETRDERLEQHRFWTLLSSLQSHVSLDALQAEYRQVFGHTISQECPPYETEYGSAHLFQQAQRLGDIAGFYRAFGLEVSDRAKERLDHIAVELEFMGFLAFKEAYALSHHGEEKASICREAERRFLEEHLGRWAPLFAKLLGRKAQEGFYRELASFLEAFITSECRCLEARPFAFHEGDLKPIAFEPEGACFPCGVKDLCFGEPKEGE